MDKVRIILDGLGGDNAPYEIVKGAIDAAQKSNNIDITITGYADKIRSVIDELGYTGDSIHIKETTEFIEMSEHPVNAIKKKKDSSMVVGLKMIRDKEGDVFISAGNSGAVLVGGQTIVGRLKGIKSTPLASIIPTVNGKLLLLDSGARVDISAEILAQYAVLGSAYMKSYFGISNPKVSILNIGAEEEKGNKLVQETFPLLKNNENINFSGSLEARDLLNADCDVVVAEGFSGNVALKTMEGVSKVFLKTIKKAFTSSLKSKIGALLVYNSFRKELSKFDIKSTGGACLLGCKGVVLKTHGSSTFEEVSNTIIQGEKLIQNDYINRLETELSK